MHYQINVRKVRGIQKTIWKKITKTFFFRKNRTGKPMLLLGHYGGVFQVGNEQLVMHADGVGTKVLVAQQLGKYDTVGIDAVAMNVNDILCLGAEPLVGVDYIALAKENHFLVSELVKGLVRGAEESDCAIIGGETAIVPEIIRGGSTPDYAFDLAFTVVGRIRNRMITGKEIKTGDIIIGLESSGLHSNGYTLARKLLDIKKWGNEMIKPTRIYVKPVLDVLSKNNLNGIAHITGGAFSKSTRLNKNIGFVLDNMPVMPPIFEELHRSVDIREMHRTFNCGIGMILIASQKDEVSIRNTIKKHHIKSHVIGYINRRKGVWLKADGKEIKISD